MANKSVILFLALLIGALAIPSPEYDNSKLFEHVDTEARIVGGTEAPAGSVPYMAIMTSGIWIRSLVCGGSVVSTRTILTAAHCIDAVFSWGSLSSSLQVTVGTNRWASGGQSYTIARNVTHQNYLSSIIKNDIGVLITNSAIQMSPLVQPVALNFNEIPGGVPARAAGFGRIRAGGAISAVLLELIVNTVDGQQCVDDVRVGAINNNMWAPPVEPHLELCTFHSAGRGMCNGDSGSALVAVGTGQQIGLVSWGLPCALGSPDMFARLSAYRDWVNQHLVQ